MRLLQTILLVLICASVRPSAQVLPSSSGGCSISPNGLMECDILSPAPMTPRGKVYYTKPEFHVIHYSLAPGAPLKKPAEDFDNLIVGLGDGELANEAKTPASHVNLFKGAVVMMPKGGGLPVTQCGTPRNRPAGNRPQKLAAIKASERTLLSLNTQSPGPATTRARSPHHGFPSQTLH